MINDEEVETGTGAVVNEVESEKLKVEGYEEEDIDITDVCLIEEEEENDQFLIFNFQ